MMVLMSLQIQTDCRMPTGYCQAKVRNKSEARGSRLEKALGVISTQIRVGAQRLSTLKEKV